MLHPVPVPTPHPPVMILVPAMMEVDILTLFPGMFEGVLGESILKRAIAKGVISVHLHQIRDYATDKHRTTDDLPYGGGAGMVMRCEPLHGAWQAARDRNPALPVRTVLLSPQGRPLHQSRLEAWARDLPGRTRLILVCGRYEGVDERFLEECVDEEVSLGDFVLSGGEIAAMALVDGLMRLLPGALGNEASTVRESFSPGNQGLLEAPQYTRPPEWRGRKVPEALLSGHHGEIEKWRRNQALERTQRKRPDLLGSSRGAPCAHAPDSCASSGSSAADAGSSHGRPDSPGESLGGKSRGGKP